MIKIVKFPWHSESKHENNDEKDTENSGGLDLNPLATMKQTDENMTGLKYASLGFFCIHSMLLTMNTEES
jgi:hypothetical protein